jgi:hypothetical protein
VDGFEVRTGHDGRNWKDHTLIVKENGLIRWNRPSPKKKKTLPVAFRPSGHAGFQMN